MLSVSTGMRLVFKSKLCRIVIKQRSDRAFAFGVVLERKPVFFLKGFDCLAEGQYGSVAAFSVFTHTAAGYRLRASCHIMSLKSVNFCISNPQNFRYSIFLVG